MRTHARLLALLATLLLALLAAGPAAAGPNDAYPLKRGSAGPRVAALQWLLTGQKPSAYRGIRTFAGKPNGYLGKRTQTAIVRMKRRLGYPTKHLKPIAGRQFIRILTGKQKRPIGWIARAARRVKEGIPGQSACAQRVLGVARSQLGVRENPFGSNWGSRIPVYLAASGLRSAAPWCAAWTQWVFKTARYGIFANGSAAVFYIRDYARNRGWLRARPAPARLVMFLDRRGHIGIVERVTASGFYSLEGNASNAVRRRFHRIGPRPMVFGELPRCA